MIKKLLFFILILTATVSFSQEKSIDKLSAAPNPFTNTTKISFTSSTKSSVIFTVKNVLGKTVFTKKITTKKGKNTIPFSKNNLAKGVYVYSIRNNKKAISKRLVIR